MAIATWSPDGKIGGLTIKTLANVKGSTITNGTAYEVGKGKFKAVTKVTVLDVDANDEHYIMVVEANTRAATSTWYEIGTLFAGGAHEVTGRAADDAADEYEIILDNPYDYQVRVTTYILGSTNVGITSSVILYPLSRKH
jgi:hypothetical protein